MSDSYNINLLGHAKTMLETKYEFDNNSPSDKKVITKKHYVFSLRGNLVSLQSYLREERHFYEKHLYSYDTTGKLIKLEVFLDNRFFSKIDRKYIYEYDHSNRLVKEKKYEYENSLEYFSKITVYIYDSHSNLLEKKIYFSADFESSKELPLFNYIYSYNDDHQLESYKKIEWFDFEVNKTFRIHEHCEYQYDSFGNRSNEIMFSENSKNEYEYRSYHVYNSNNLIRRTVKNYALDDQYEWEQKINKNGIFLDDIIYTKISRITLYKYNSVKQLIEKKLFSIFEREKIVSKQYISLSRNIIGTKTSHKYYYDKEMNCIREDIFHDGSLKFCITRDISYYT